LSGAGENRARRRRIKAESFSHVGKFDQRRALAAAAVLLFLRFAAMEGTNSKIRRSGNFAFRAAISATSAPEFWRTFPVCRAKIHRRDNANDVIPQFSAKRKNGNKIFRRDAFKRDGCGKSVEFRANSGNFRQRLFESKRKNSKPSAFRTKRPPRRCAKFTKNTITF
jgi:hypothetical protein